MLEPRVGRVLMTALFVLLSLNGLLQVALELVGDLDDPPVLLALQLASGSAALVTAIGAWRRASWSPIASVIYGVITAGMLFALPSILDLGPDERGGIFTGATVVLLFGIAAGWMLHRQHARTVVESGAGRDELESS